MTAYLAIARFIDTDVPVRLCATFEEAHVVARKTTIKEAVAIAADILDDTISDFVCMAVISFYAGRPGSMAIVEPEVSAATSSPEIEPWVIPFPANRVKPRSA